MPRTVFGALVMLAASLLAAPLAADWLVLDDGTHVRTLGKWEQRGKLAVFTTQDGMLASLRLDSIDLEASLRAAGEAPGSAAPPPNRAPAKAETATFVLTDADVEQFEEPVEVIEIAAAQICETDEKPKELSP